MTRVVTSPTATTFSNSASSSLAQSVEGSLIRWTASSLSIFISIWKRKAPVIVVSSWSATLQKSKRSASETETGTMSKLRLLLVPVLLISRKRVNWFLLIGLISWLPRRYDSAYESRWDLVYVATSCWYWSLRLRFSTCPFKSDFNEQFLINAPLVKRGLSVSVVFHCKSIG